VYSNRTEDYDDWLQCNTCFFLIHYVEIEKEAEIKDAIENIDNPHESKTIIKSLSKRTFFKSGPTKRLLEVERERMYCMKMKRLMV
jgi:hypothetical protein